MSEVPDCPKCNSTFTYLDRDIYTCPECAYEWSEADAQAAADAKLTKDANGTVLQNGDNVTLIKDLKLKGSSQVVKVGTKVRNIRLVDADHNIDCKVEGIGQLGLKSEFVRKSS